MGYIAKDSGGADFVPTPSGTHMARCIWILDIGIQGGGQFKPRAKVVFGFELVNEFMDDGRPFMISAIYTNSLNEKASLSAMLEGWRGKSFTDQERKDGYDFSGALGKACQVNVVHTEKNGRVYGNVASVSNAPKGVTTPGATNTLLLYSVDEPDEAVFAKLPKWIQEKILTRIVEEPAKTSAGDVDPFDDEIAF